MQLPTDSVDCLVEAATEARTSAYCPYSDFAVGAAVLAESGEVFIGCNVENASFGLTVCAERNAVAAAVAAGVRRLIGLAVVTDTAPPATPCGACRQVLSEFGNYPVILANLDGERRPTTVSDLIPEAFDRSQLPGR